MYLFKSCEWHPFFAKQKNHIIKFECNKNALLNHLQIYNIPTRTHTHTHTLVKETKVEHRIKSNVNE